MPGRRISRRSSPATCRSWRVVPETVLARAGGVDIKKLLGDLQSHALSDLRSPKLKSLKDGKGKKFAISRSFAVRILTRSALRQSGVDPKDVTMLQIGATPARFTTLATGIVDATILWFPVTSAPSHRHEQALRSQGSLS